MHSTEGDGGCGCVVVCVCVVCVTVGQLAGCSCWWFVLVCLSIGWLVSWLVGDGAHWSHPGVQHQQQQIGAAALPVVSTPPTCASCSCRSTSMSLLPPPQRQEAPLPLLLPVASAAAPARPVPRTLGPASHPAAAGNPAGSSRWIQ